jgi:hypothetical protein
MASDAKSDDNDATKQILDEPISSIKIYTYPKVIFMWPTMMVGLICGIGMILVGDLVPIREVRVARSAAGSATATAGATKAAPAPVDAQRDAATPAQTTTPPESFEAIGAKADPVPGAFGDYFTSWQNMLGVLFLIVFAANMVVMALDFPRFTIIAVFLVITTLTFLLLWLAPHVNILRPLLWFTRHVYAVANAGFYFTIVIVHALAYLAIWVTRRLDYWEISPNEILHHHGPLSDLERFPTTQLKFSKEIPDILEYMLGLGSGKLTFSFGLDQRSFVLEQVLFINQKEEALKRMMGQMNVRMLEKGNLTNT